MSERYAIYWTPEKGSALERVGQRWLGRDVRTGQPTAPLSVPGLSTDVVHRITKEPARYGLHATLKPPFTLRPGVTADSLGRAMQDFARTQSPVHLAGMRLVRLGHFLALVPVSPSEDLRTLSNDCVSNFDRFRQPPTQEELVRRRASSSVAGGLSPRQEELLQQWGYPYVFDEFRFHVTLTGRLPDIEIEKVETAIGPLVSEFSDAAIKIGAISIFVQPGPTRPFVLVREFELGQALSR